MLPLMAAPKESTISCKGIEYTFLLLESMPLRVNLKTQPQNPKTAKLQKGVTLVYIDDEDEGGRTRLRVPILEYATESYFPDTSSLQVPKQDNRVTASKDYDMYMTKRAKFLDLSLINRTLRKLVDTISSFYKRRKRLTRSILPLKNLLLRFGVIENFEKIQTKGKVTITGAKIPSRKVVRDECGQVSMSNFERIFIVNNQNTLLFWVFFDSDGLINGETSAWKPVPADSTRASDYHYRLNHSLRTTRGSLMRRCKEFPAYFVDGIGLNYELIPESDSSAYKIELLGEVD